MTGLVLATSATMACGAVDVRFVDAGSFIDGTLQGYGDEPASNPVLAEIRRHLLALGERCIPAEQSLELVVRDLDLAGHYDWRYRESFGNFRLLPNVAWARLTIEYIWRDAGGGLIAASVDQLHSAEFVSNRSRLRVRDIALPDEKQLLDRWFEPRFCGSGARGAASSATR